MAFLQAGIVASTIINLFRGKDDKPISPVDFIPGEKQESITQSPEEQVAVLREFFRTPSPGKQ